jgi:hypothetical protein
MRCYLRIGDVNMTSKKKVRCCRADTNCSLPVLSPSRPGELHPEPLTDPDVRLSPHPARATAEGCLSLLKIPNC